MKKIIYQFKNKEASEWSIFSPINGAGETISIVEYINANPDKQFRKVVFKDLEK